MGTAYARSHFQEIIDIIKYMGVSSQQLFYGIDGIIKEANFIDAIWLPSVKWLQELKYFFKISILIYELCSSGCRSRRPHPEQIFNDMLRGDNCGTFFVKNFLWSGQTYLNRMDSGSTFSQRIFKAGAWNFWKPGRCDETVQYLVAGKFHGQPHFHQR